MSRGRVATLALSLLLLGWPVGAEPSDVDRAEQVQMPTTGEGLYTVGCAKCHGADGTGGNLDELGFDVPLPNFADCAFASREPDADWIAVSHDGGGVRGFDRTMPAFGLAFNLEQFQLIMDYIRGFCSDTRWPRGELNLPRPLVTEKAYPEDEAVWTTTVNAEDPGAVTNDLLYERRFGPQNQLEVKLPFGAHESTGESNRWHAGVGDVAVGLKRAMFHSVERGAIFSLGAEVIMPTGDEDRGLGKGTTVFEPFVAFGQMLPGEGFLHVQAGAEIPTDEDRAEREGFWRVALGKSLTQGSFGRTWSPMVELLGSRELESGGTTAWDVLPQVQVTLNTRQHVMANVGVRVPLTDSAMRPTQILVYLLWDWYDGGFLDGW